MTWRLLITRPVEECAALAATLAERGVFSSAMPLLAIEPLAEMERIISPLAYVRACSVQRAACGSPLYSAPVSFDPFLVPWRHVTALVLR